MTTTLTEIFKDLFSDYPAYVRMAAAALDAPCGVCGGTGARKVGQRDIILAMLSDAGARVSPLASSSCECCNGTGRSQPAGMIAEKAAQFAADEYATRLVVIGDEAPNGAA